MRSKLSHPLTGIAITILSVLSYSTTAFAEAAITAPADGSTLSSSSQTFTWNYAGTGNTPDSARIWVGSTAGGSDYFNGCSSGATLPSNVNVTGLPTDGSTVHVQIVGYGGSVANDCTGWTGAIRNYTYTAHTAATDPEITSPAAGSTFGGSSQGFNWQSNGTAVTAWWLYLGNDLASNDIHDSGSLGANITSTTVTGLPTDGRNVFTRLYWTTGGGVWSYVDYLFIASGTLSVPSFTAPAAGSTLGSNQTFQWTTNGATVCNWWLYVGSVQGGSDVHNSGALASSTLQQNVSSLPNDFRDLWARLWYGCGLIWAFVDLQLIAQNTTVPTITSATPFGNIAGVSHLFQWIANGQASNGWWLYVGTTQGSNNIHDSGWQFGGVGLDEQVNGLLADGSTIWVRLWWLDPVVGWRFADYQFVSVT